MHFVKQIMKVGLLTILSSLFMRLSPYLSVSVVVLIPSEKQNNDQRYVK